jgi:hypothetical protein
MIVKYGKGYAMTETTLLVCDFSEAADTAEKLAKKRKKEFTSVLLTYFSLHRFTSFTFWFSTDQSRSVISQVLAFRSSVHFTGQFSSV